MVPTTRRSTLGDRAFAVTGPRAWNSLPDAIQHSPPLSNAHSDSSFSAEFLLSFHLITVTLCPALEVTLLFTALYKVTIMHYITLQKT